LKQFEQNKFNYADAGNIFLFAILMPQLIGLFFVFFVSITANFFGITYEIVMENIFAKVLTLFLAQIGFIIVFFSYVYVKRIDWKNATKIKNKINLKQVVLLIVIAAVSLFMFSPLINLVDHLISLTGYASSSELPIDLKTVSGVIIGVISLAIFPAIFEELVFRGVLFQGFIKKFDYKKAIVFSALLFALMHTSIQQTTYQFIIGLMLAYAFYITGSLLAPIILHFFNNFIVIMLNIFVTGGEISPEPMFQSLSDYSEVLIFTAIGAYIIWQLFVLLKKISINNVFETEAVLQNVEDLAIIDTSTNESLADVEVKIKRRFEPNYLFKIGIMLGILFWIFDFITYIS